MKQHTILPTTSEQPIAADDDLLLDDELENDEFETSQRVDAGSGTPSADGLYEHFRFVADRGQGAMRVDKFLADRIVGGSRSRIQNAADQNCILVNGTAVKSSYKVKPGDVVCVMMDRPRHVLEILPDRTYLKQG